MDIIEEARKTCDRNGRGCHEDVNLLVSILEKLVENPVVVHLGAGEIFTLAVLGARPNTNLVCVDVDTSSRWHEEMAFERLGIDKESRQFVLMASARYASFYDGPPVDLLIIDADHSEFGVLSDLKAWQSKMNQDDHYIFCHDYDAKQAPYYYPGVEEACNKFFGKKPLFRDGWSAAWQIVNGDVVDPPEPPKAEVKKVERKFKPKKRK